MGLTEQLTSLSEEEFSDLFLEVLKQRGLTFVVKVELPRTKTLVPIEEFIDHKVIVGLENGSIQRKS